jgi:YD repeat-containing protein
VNTHNTVTDNADDTVATVTDPRGVVATYSHNDRHLVTQISYSVPSGLQSTVPARPTATFTYDSVGNRLTMSSSVSSVTHVYDTASRMTSETRSFSGVTGNFTLTYSYNAAGALMSLQDAFSATVSYSYDKTGQLTSVGASGGGFPSVSSFINSAGYRAWGAPKSIAYDSDVTETATFNERMQPASYKMAWVGTSNEIESTFDYYDDGRVNHAYDANSSFDRRYEYDFAGRMKEAYTGREALGQTPTTPSTDPYRQTMTYDAFGNQTARSGKLWSNTMATYSATFTNNRSGSNEYDAAGNVVDGGGLHKFDAAGSQAQSITHALVTSETSYHEYTATITLARDGAGAPVKRTQYIDRWDGEGEDPIVQTEETIITYSLQSSVLKMVIDEIDPNGAKTKGHIYAGGRKIAEQDVTSSSNSVRFKLTNPVTATCWETNESGVSFSVNEYDPVGAIVPTWDPYNFAGPPLYPDIVQTHEQLYVKVR